MILASRARSLALPLVGLALTCAPVLAQEVCPRASGADAEAGWAAYSANDVDVARTRFEAALARCANDDYARTGLGYVALRQGAVDDAVRLWEIVVAADSSNVDALTGLGLAEWRRGDIRAVRLHFTRVLAISPDHPTALEYLARTSGDATPTPTDPADAAWVTGDRARAMALYEARLATNPSDETALLRSALIIAWEGRYAEALDRLGRLLARTPGHLDARVARARVLAWSGDIRGAQREAREVLAVQPDNAEALEALASFQSWAGDMDAALGTFDELIAIAPGAGAPERLRAQALARASRYEASRAAYDALLAENADDVEARLGLAQTLAYAGDFDAAIAEYDRILAGRPREVRALVGKGRALAWSGRLVAAERVTESALEIDRSSAAAWAGLGEIYRAEGRPEDARDALETAVGLAPTDADVLDQLRSVNLGLASAARPSVIFESDSDGNRMMTTSVAATWHVASRLDLRAWAYHRDLEQGTFDRTAQGVTIVSGYELGPGWLVTGGIGGSRTNGTGTPELFEYQAGVKTPERHRVIVALNLSSAGLNETASLAELGGRFTEVSLSGRWNPRLDWRIDAAVGLGEVSGTEDNDRRSASLSTSVRLGSMFSLGASGRGFSFAKDLYDGYFDPEFYGVAELTGTWLHRPGPWTLSVELAPGVQMVGSDGDASSSVRSNARVAYRVGPGREVSLSFGYSSAGLVASATGTPDYDYTAIILGSSWTF